MTRVINEKYRTDFFNTKFYFKVLNFIFLRFESRDVCCIFWPYIIRIYIIYA